MKNIIACLILSILFTSSLSAQNNHPKLESGIYAEITTNKGVILLLLEYQKVPMTTANFVALAEGDMNNNAIPDGVPFYDGIKFHRVIPNFMIQGGDARTNPKNTAKKGLGYKFIDEFHPDLKHTGPGILSMANAGPGTNSSQFFITHVKTPWLDNKHTVFGRVIMGQEIVNLTAQGDRIVTLKIIRKGDDAKKFNAVKVFNELRAQ